MQKVAEKTKSRTVFFLMQFSTKSRKAKKSEKVAVAKPKGTDDIP